MSWKQAIAVCIVSIGSSLGGGVAGALYIQHRYEVRFGLPEQKVKVRVPKTVEVTADLIGKVDVALDTTVKTEVPLSQHFKVPIDQTITAEATVDHDVPVKANVHVKQLVPLDTKIYINTTAQTELLGKPIQIPVQATVPIKTSVPLDVIVPIDQMVRLKFTVPVSAHVHQIFDIPVSVKVSAAVPVRAQVDVPPLSGLKARVNMPDEPLEAVVEPIDFRLPLREFALEPDPKP